MNEGDVLKLLAQTASQTSPAIPAFDYSVWIPRTYRPVMHGAMIFAATLLLGALVLYLLRRRAARFRVKSAFVVGTLTAAFYLGIFTYRGKEFAVAEDPIVWWVNRVAAAAMLFVILRLADRVALVQLLTRGGRVAMPRFVHQICNMVLATFAFVIYGSIAFDWNIDKFLAGSAVVSIVLGLALQETLGNFFGGLVMQASPPFAIGDWIVCGTHEGRVVDMTWRAVTLHTDDDNFILLPNATVAKAEIVNYHAPSTATARHIKVGLEYALPPLDAIAVLEAAARETPGVLPTPQPRARLIDFADSAVIYQIKFWISEPQKHDEIEPDVRLNVWYRLKEKGYNIPFPIRTVEHIGLEKKTRRAQEAAKAQRLAVFASVPLLTPLSPAQKDHLAEIANDIVLAPGQFLFRQNDTGDSFYIISRGTVDVLMRPEGGTAEKTIATLGIGDFFGEMSALTGQPRTATIRAASAFSCIQIEKRDLMEIFQTDPSIMEKISAVVARRNAQREAHAHGPAESPPAEVINAQQKSLLTRMKRFFRLGLSDE